ncbi:MAG: tRNA (guanosine(37)-N1)-methyltransferase TrmD [Holosporales bacterium]|jgi:tRNA (guanine37-N1)-methyltransferase|nr:tRNA (guanosine(37)-N1)-methyltransferase TrmD [Holosporales bacterium]
MLITVVTIFPEMFPGPLSHSLIGKGIGRIWNLKIVDIRNFAEDKRNTVDDTPYGGGPGMVMKPDVVHEAMNHALSFYKNKPEIVFMTPRGGVFSNKMAKDFSKNHEGMIILCGRYEGVDQRVIDYWKKKYEMKEVSIGDYVLFGGEIPAMVVVDTCLRFSSGIMNNIESTVEESFSIDLLEYPQYTKPMTWNGYDVPSVLLSGNHGKIASWKLEQSKQVTRDVRPDLWARFKNNRE